MSDKTCNGWTNYATWRVNLEICDDMVNSLAENEATFADVYALSQHIEADTDEVITGYGNVSDGLALDYARAFLADVNWYEIAEHAANDYPQLITNDEEV